MSELSEIFKRLTTAQAQTADAVRMLAIFQAAPRPVPVVKEEVELDTGKEPEKLSANERKVAHWKKECRKRDAEIKGLKAQLLNAISGGDAKLLVEQKTMRSEHENLSSLVRSECDRANQLERDLNNVKARNDALIGENETLRKQLAKFREVSTVAGPTVIKEPIHLVIDFDECEVEGPSKKTAILPKTMCLILESLKSGVAKEIKRVSQDCGVTAYNIRDMLPRFARTMKSLGLEIIINNNVMILRGLD